MNNTDIKALAKQRTPIVQTTYFDDYFRHDIINHLNTKDCVGIELGVAGGHFSKRMVDSGKFTRFFGVDLYEDHHNTQEYISAIKTVGLEKNYTLLRMSFDESIELFEDNYFDFIYFDGYAHTGEEGGKTFSDWFKKLKIGGMFSGDDYHDDWPLVKWAVNDMVSKVGCGLNVTGQTETTHLNRYPSWFFVKEKHAHFAPNADLLDIGGKIRNATRKKKSGTTQVTLDQIKDVLRQVKSQHPHIAQELKNIL